jgi:hypothetical protein
VVHGEVADGCSRANAVMPSRDVRPTRTTRWRRCGSPRTRTARPGWTASSRHGPGRMVGPELDSRYRRRRMIRMQHRRRSPVLPVLPLLLPLLPGLSVRACCPAWIGRSAVVCGRSVVVIDGPWVATPRRPGHRVHAHGPGGGDGPVVPDRLGPVFRVVHPCTNWCQRRPFRPPVLRHMASDSRRAEARSWSRRGAGDRANSLPATS